MLGEPLSFQLGRDGFIWWVGVVEDINDPIGKLRCRVRIFGWHDADTAKLATQDLPWAMPLAPVTQSNKQHNLREGDWVVGFFMDATLGQQPVILGVLPAYNTK